MFDEKCGKNKGRKSAEPGKAHSVVDKASSRLDAFTSFVSGPPIVSRRFDELIKEANIIIEPVSAEQARLAREAYRDFGKGLGNKAKLNFGDCFAYALSKATGEPLPFVGNDFEHTDVREAIK